MLKRASICYLEKNKPVEKSLRKISSSKNQLQTKVDLSFLKPYQKPTPDFPLFKKLYWYGCTVLIYHIPINTNIDFNIGNMANYFFKYEWEPFDSNHRVLKLYLLDNVEYLGI